LSSCARTATIRWRRRRTTGVDTLTGEGLAEAITGAEVVVDVANAPDWDDAAVLNFFQTSARNLLPRRPMTSPPPWPTSP
jgi:hypothetical protein